MMRRYLADLRVRTKLVLLLLVPLGFLIAFRTSAILEKAGVAREAGELRTLASLCVRMSAVVHETQRERGATGVFLGKGASFAADLQAQRVRTDTKISALRGSLGSFDANRFGPGFATHFAAAMAKLDSIYAHRRAVDSNEMTGNQGINFYTELDARFLSAIGHISQVSTNLELSRSVAAYEDFLQAKERAGIERATLTVVFGQDKFAPGVFPKLLAAISNQDLYKDLFLSLATPQQKALYVEKTTGHVNDETSRMRQVALDRAQDGQFGIDSAYWFKMMTAKIDALKEIEDVLSSELVAKADALQAAASAALAATFILMITVMLASLAIAFMISRSVTRPLSRAVEAAEKIAAGDLTTRIEAGARDEPGQLLTSMKTMTDRLAAMMGEVGAGAVELSAVARSVSAASHGLARGTNEQAAGVKETAVSLHEMSATVTVNAKNCGRMDQAATAGAKDADQAGRAVKDTVEAMKVIASKLTLIEEIASRTNLLAINATIEAAGAGEHGKAFAVVAMEVRKLAERSTMSAREIKELTAASLGIAERSGQMLVRLVPAIQTTAGFAQEVTMSSKEQAIGIGQIHQAMSQIDSATRDAARAAGEMSSASDQLAKRANRLRELIAFFTLPRDESAPTRADGTLHPALGHSHVAV